MANLGLDEFFDWYGREPRPGFTKATVAAWRVALEARGLGAVSINVRITAVRKLAVEAADNGLLAPGLAAGITRVKGVCLCRVTLAPARPTDERPGADEDDGSGLVPARTVPARTRPKAPGWRRYSSGLVIPNNPASQHQRS